MTNSIVVPQALRAETTSTGTPRSATPRKSPIREIPHTIWSGFYKKTLAERQRQLSLVYPELFEDVQEIVPFVMNGLDENIADNMIENCVGTVGLPLGLALNFVINNSSTVIPMAVEEPSVIAAVSNAAKTISSFSLGNTFEATTSDRNVIYAQIQLLDVTPDRMDQVVEKLNSSKATIMKFANQYCQSMVNRGGGVVDVEIRRVTRNTPTQRSPAHVIRERKSKEWLVVHLHLDVCDAMGANAASTVAEGTAPLLAEVANARIGLRIVSNLCTQRLARAAFKIPTSRMGYKKFPGEDVVDRMLEAYEWAEDDMFRATTHNKGIMNGVDAVAIATGQDWRAIEAAAHAWASRDGHYRALTKYWLERQENSSELLFCGELEMPIAVGTKGGVLKTHPVFQYTMGLMGDPDSRTFAGMLACVGLAQNFAALRALATEGIQRGHMSLHARNIAIAAGAPPQAIAEVTAYMIAAERIQLQAAREYLEAHYLHSIIRNRFDTKHAQKGKAPSMFYFEEAKPNDVAIPGLENVATLNVVFQTLTTAPNNLELTKSAQANSLNEVIFGDKSHSWLTNMMQLADSIKLSTSADRERSTHMLVRKLKILSILMNILARRLMTVHPKETARFVGQIFGHSKFRDRAGSISELPKMKSGSYDESDSIISPTPIVSPKRSRANSVIEATLGKRGKNNPPSVGQFIDSIKVLRDTVEEWQDQSNGAQLPGLQPPPALELTRVPSPFNQDVDTDTKEEWLLPDTEIFKRDPRELWDGLGQGDDATLLLVGLPLLFGMWQVFEVRVAQYSGQELLASAILEEQRRVISSIAVIPLTPGIFGKGPVNTAANATPFESFEDFYAVHAKRGQVTLLLLLDALTFDAKLINANVVEFIACLGLYGESELIKAHDLGRLARDRAKVSNGEIPLSIDGGLSSGLVNSYLLWLKAKDLEDSETNLAAFIKDTDRSELRDRIRSNTDLWSGVFDAQVFETVAKATKAHWNVQ